MCNEIHDNTPVQFGSSTCYAQSIGIYLGVPSVFYVPKLTVPGLWSFSQLLDQCLPTIVDFKGGNGSSVWGFYLHGSDGAPLAIVQQTDELLP